MTPTSYPAIAPATSAPTPIAPRPPSTTTPMTSAAGSSTAGPTPPAAAPPPKKKRRSKVDSACRFCRRSHMQCSGERPCARCIKREIAHLCTDEPIAGLDPAQAQAQAAAQAAQPPQPVQQPAPAPPPPPAVSVSQDGGVDPGGADMLNTLGLDMGDALGNATAAAGHMDGGAFAGMLQGNLFGPTNTAESFYNAAATQASQPSIFTPDFNLAMLDLANDGLGAGLGLDMTATSGEGEFHGLGLSEFLQSLNDPPLFTPDQPVASTSQQQQIGGLPINTDTGLAVPPGTAGAGEGKDKTKSTGPSVPGSPINKTERFLLTAADQKDGSRSDRLARVIHAKFEAGLLRPYNHVAGYTRLMKYMADNMTASSRQRTLHTLSEFRPTFRAIASGLTDLDLVFIEEAFERLLLDYDRVFSSMGIPSCLWRRTGEIYKGNKEFAALVGVPIEHLQGGKLAIYELMAEESAVNYWEKYGNIAFDSGQKAVLTSCVLINQSILSRKRRKAGADKGKIAEEAMVSACFSFTIRRDSYGIPSLIVGNFIRL
ncbi:Transcription factor [Rhodotorula kratochvilovae]